MSASLKKGISVIICCYNSQRVIIPTLHALSLQRTHMDLMIEVVLVNNNSTDNTATVAKDYWTKSNTNTPLRIILEKRSGLSIAKETGILKARHDIIIFVDDDNELDDDYVQTCYEIMTNNDSLGACGGVTRLPEEYCDNFRLPAWWSRYKGSYAIGSPAAEEGKVKTIWGAGMCLKKEAYNVLVDRGFKFNLTGRKGGQALSGEDSELCLALNRINYDVFFTPRLRLVHRIEKSRISDEHIRAMMKGFGRSHVYLGIYKNFEFFGFTNKWLELTISALVFLKHSTYGFIISSLRGEINFSKIMAESRLSEIYAMSHKEYKDIAGNIKSIREPIRCA